MEHDLNDMMVFLAVVETGSFTSAAERLAIPKANVSRKVSKLEKNLEVTLLERSTRSQHLTEAGRRYLLHCKRIHSEIDLATASVCELFQRYAGDLKVGASVTTGQEILKPALADFLKKYPELNLQLVLGNKRVDFIEEGFDVVIRIGQLSDSMLIAKKLGSVKRRLYASEAYVKQNELPTTPEQLSKLHFLVNPINNDNKINLHSVDKETHIINKAPRLAVDDFSMLKQAITDGLGYGVLPNYIAKQELREGKFVNLLPNWAMEDVDVYALYPKHKAKIPKVKAFIDFVTELYQDICD